MNFLRPFAACVLLAASVPAQTLPIASLEKPGFDPELTVRVDAAVARAIDTDKIPGAVVLIGRHGKVAHKKSYGLRSVRPEREPMSVDTIFDLASLTKPLATASSIMRLIERGRLKLDDKVGNLLPDFNNGGKSSITVEQLLRHRSGLIADNPMSDYVNGRDEAWKRLANLKTTGEPGVRYLYSDVNYLILGRIVERVSGESLDRFAERELFEPLTMKTARFRRTDDSQDLAKIAPTESVDGKMLRGTVHDPRARALGNVAGHAGLFATADDLALFAAMLLNDGKASDGRVIFRPETIAAMISPGTTKSPQARGLGWDVATPYSSPRGKVFGPRSFGHTGFTGTSLWLDPETKSFVILLTSRVHPDGKTPSPTALRAELATIVGECLDAGTK